MITRNKTPSKYVCYGLYLYFSGLTLRRASERLSCFIKRNHVSIWNWIQAYHHLKISSKRKRISEYVAETILKVGSEYIWLWIAIEPENKQILALFAKISKERNMFVAERLLAGLINSHGKHPVSTDGFTWYPMACSFLGLEHHIHSFLAKKREKPD